MLDSIATEPPAKVEENVELTDPDDIDALLDSIAAESSAKVEENVELTDPDDIDALLDGIQQQDDSNVDVDKVLPDVAQEKVVNDNEDNENAELISNFTQEYVTPFLSMDFSELRNDTNAEENINELDQEQDDLANDEIVEQSNIELDSENISDELDIDAIISEANEQSSTIDDDDLDIGDDLLDNVSESVATENDEDELPEFMNDFDESALTDLLNEEKLDDDVELSPDFSDSDVLADLLNDDEQINEEVADTIEIGDIKELDNLDFDEILANIKDETISPDSSEPIDEPEFTHLFEDQILDIGDEYDEIDSESEAEKLKEKEKEKDYISVDSLLSEVPGPSAEEEPYDKTKIDVGLGEFPEFTKDVNQIDVDEVDGNGIAAKLDLAKVYLEIGDVDNAEVILEDVVNKGDEQQQKEALQLLETLK